MPLTIATRPAHRLSGTDTPPDDPVRGVLARVFAAAPDLPAFHPAALPHPFPGGDRRPAETVAAARAAACPDLFVVHAPDPAAGERVIADVARAAAGRVLILSPNPVAADRIADRLARAGDVAVARALAEDENPARPLPAAARVTTAALGPARAEQHRRDAAAAVAAAEARVTALDRLTGYVARAAELEAELAALAARRRGTEAEVRARAAPPPPVPALARLAEVEVRARVLEDRVAELRGQHAEAARKPGFFARLLGKPKPGPDAADAEKHLHEAERELGELTAHAAALQAEADAATAAANAEREKRIADEIAARCAPLDGPAVGIEAELRRTRAEAEALLGGALPTDVLAARDVAAGELAAARDRAAEHARHGADLVRQFLAELRVVVGTPGSLAADPVFEAAADSGPPFALLVLDRAEELPESEFVRLAKIAARWVLVGDASPDAPKPHLNGAPPRHHPGRNGRPAEVPFAARVARALDREMWAAEGDRLVCRLAHPHHERRRLTREPLHDRPDIELRFVTPHDEPVLAEVAFPAGHTVAAAKAFLFEELGEVLVCPCGECQWHHAPDAITACWPAAEHGANPSEVAWVDLEPGVREKVVGAAPAAHTAAVVFDPAAGWDAEKAAAWLAAHTAPHPGRFAAVPRAGTPVPRPVGIA